MESDKEKRFIPYKHVMKPGELFEYEYGRGIVNKYGIPRHISDTDYPMFDMYEDTRMALNPDVDEATTIIKKISSNHGYRPTQAPNHVEGSFCADVRCPCPDFVLKGKCVCGLFVPMPLTPPEKYSEYLNSIKEDKE